MHINNVGGKPVGLFDQENYGSYQQAEPVEEADSYPGNIARKAGETIANTGATLLSGDVAEAGRALVSGTAKTIAAIFGQD